jgi:catechol 2,3-dioxygenase-like lactoylglutathione lyase family enzyme
MTTGIFDDATAVMALLRVRDLAASVSWYREKLGLEPIHVGADGSHPIASYRIAGSIVSMWQLAPGQTRDPEDNDRNTYVVAVMSCDLGPLRQALLDRGVDVGEVRRSADNEFLWFHDPDGNRFELSRPLRR